MGRRPHLLLLAPLVAAAAIALGAGTASSQDTGAAPERAAQPAAIVNRVDAAGVLRSPSAGWRVAHPEPGVYRVHLPADLVLDVQDWDAAADVTIVPHGHDVTEVRFSHAGRGVDTGFDLLGVAGS